MRVSREKAAENRERIAEAASRLFREKGFDGVGIDAIMQAAGLTHGGFYGHFASKEDLAVEAVTRALDKSAEHQNRLPTLKELVSEYLSEKHCAARANGCAITALGADMARQGEGVRGSLTRHLKTQVDRLAEFFSGPKRRKRALATLSGLVGALTLARAVNDPVFSAEILAAATEAFGG